MPVAVGAIILLECGEFLQSTGRLRSSLLGGRLRSAGAHTSHSSLALSCSGFIARHSFFIFNSDRLIPQRTRQPPRISPALSLALQFKGERTPVHKPGGDPGTQ